MKSTISNLDISMMLYMTVIYHCYMIIYYIEDQKISEQ